MQLACQAEWLFEWRLRTVLGIGLASAIKQQAKKNPLTLR